MATKNENRIIVNLTPALAQWVKRRAAASNRSHSNFLKDLIAAWAERDGLGGYPETEPKYLEAAAEDKPKLAVDSSQFKLDAERVKQLNRGNLPKK